MSDQLPPELKERKKKLWPAFQEAKQNKVQAKWLGEKLLIGSELKEEKPDTAYCDTSNSEPDLSNINSGTPHQLLYRGVSSRGI